MSLTHWLLIALIFVIVEARIIIARKLDLLIMDARRPLSAAGEDLVLAELEQISSTLAAIKMANE